MRLIPDIIKNRFIPDETNIIFDVFQQNFTDKPIMVDVGACKGDALIKFLKQNWSVHAFEPKDSNHNELLDNTIGSQITINKKAVSNEPSEKTTFFSSNQNDGIGSLMQFSDSHDNSEITTVTTLEIYCDEKNISEIDYLKVDAEGFDKLVLEGLNWSKICPRLIMCEYEDKKTIQLDYTKDDLINFLTDRGYRIIISVWKPIISYGGAHRWQQFVLSDFEHVSKETWGNIIAINDDKLYHDFIKISKSLSRFWSLNLYYYIRKIIS